MNLRIFRPSYREHAPFRRRVLFAAIGTLLILASIGIVASRALANHSLAHGISRAATPLPPTPTPTVAPQPILVVAPLALKVPCTVGKAVQFTISNTGSANLDWSSNAALYAPRLQVSNLNGTIAAGASLTVQVALGQAVKASQQLALVIQSNGGTVQITVTLSPC